MTATYLVVSAEFIVVILEETLLHGNIREGRNYIQRTVAKKGGDLNISCHCVVQELASVKQYYTA
jgi:transcriptional regulator with GAF, ATPase, and Fis domain